MLDATADEEPTGRWQALWILALACFLGMTCWFSASAVLPQLRREWGIPASAGAWLTISVQLGFVAGALVSALLNLPDLIAPRRLMLAGAAGSAVANGLLVLAGGPSLAVLLRFLTGASLALVYPPSLKAVATWFRKERGAALGVMIGALTLGSALPHLINALGGVQWQWVVLTTSALTFSGGLLAEFLGRDGPFPFPRAVFDPRQAFRAFGNPGVRLACLGYFGHMWELYAMWAWFGVFMADTLAHHDVGAPQRWASATTFVVIGSGAAGCWYAGRLADRVGRTRVTALAMTVSGLCSLLIGWDRLPVPLVVTLGVLWGFWVVADSAQFSTMVTEVAEQHYVGTAVTLQLAVGFTLTVATIWLVPTLREHGGWHLAFASLGLGPVAGVVAMLRLRASAVAKRIAGGLG